ncbi:MAG: hypothetical protein H6779_05045 [Candidatus Nomurabacteria bacterium]|nr:hypothetical protein [Candidatus Nomurabacteria bacterium]USN87734.1 MAG: hypothetical protein H6779_05045 [Candidatus Nomurabacteria bacterium]
MSFDWNNYLELAKVLRDDSTVVTNNLTEAQQRSSVSRVYYSAYNLVLSHAKTLGYSFPYLRDSKTGKPLTGSHADLIQFCKDHTDPVINNIARDLESCRNSRVIADYEDDFPELNKKNKIAIKKVTRILKVLNP